MRVVVVGLLGEALLLGGLWWAWPPAAALFLGVQLTAWALLFEPESSEADE